MGVALALACLAVALFVLMSLDARRSDERKQHALEQMMQGLVSEKGQATLDEIALLVDHNRHVLGRYHARSRDLRAAGSYEEAARWTKDGCEAIEEGAPDFLTVLETLRRLARSVSVIVALPPLRPYAFRAWELRGLVGLGRLVHHVLMTGQERIRLRLRILAYAFGMALRWLRRSTDRVVARPEAAAEWKRVDDLVGDLDTTGEETLLTTERIVQALDAVELKKTRSE
jgi:hypothetical protein